MIQCLGILGSRIELNVPGMWTRYVPEMWLLKKSLQGPLLLTWINFSPSTDKKSHA